MGCLCTRALADFDCSLQRIDSLFRTFRLTDSYAEWRLWALCFYICERRHGLISMPETNYRFMRILAMLFMLFTSVAVHAQTDFDKRLLAKFEEAQIQSLLEKNPEVIAYWTYFLDHGYEVVDIPSEKAESVTEVISLGRNKSNFNILATEVGTPGEHPRYFRIAGTNQMLVVRSNDDFIQKFKAHTGSTY